MWSPDPGDEFPPFFQPATQSTQSLPYTDETRTQKTFLIVSFDPNDKTSTEGFGAQGFVDSDAVVDYRVDFENLADASAPAHQIVVTDVLDVDLDLTTFELTEIAFANQSIAIPNGLDHYEAVVPFDAEGTGILVDVNASLDRDTRELRLVLRAIDPTTGWIPGDPLIGLLFPNDDTGRGEGHISYRIAPNAGLPSGTEVTNRASIVFDFNDPIETPLVLNTLDDGTPTSNVESLPGSTTETIFTVNWFGQDETNGSGIAGYDIFVSVDGGEFTPFLENTQDTSITIQGEVGRTYAFYSIATDNVGHVEAAPAVADAMITIVSPLQVDAGDDQAVVEGDAVGLPTATFTFFGELSELSGTVNWGDGTTEAATLVAGTDGGTFANTHRYSDNGKYTVTLSLSDGITTVEDSLQVAASNAAPVIPPVDPKQSDEGSSFTLQLNFTDAGLADTHTATINWGDGSSVETGTVTGSAGNGQVSGTHTYADNGTYTATLSVTDDDGDTATRNVTVNVANIAPTVVPGDGAGVDEGGTFTGAGSFVDPGADTWTATVDYGDGSGELPLALADDKTFQLQHVYAENGDYSATIKVIDKDGATGAGTLLVHVANVAPAISSLSNSADEIGDADPGEAISISSAFTDVGILDTHAATIDWGDGITDAGVVTESNGSGSVAGSHAYATGGIFTITLTLTDEDGGVDTQTTTAFITGAGIHNGVLQIVGSRGNDYVVVLELVDQYLIVGDIVPQHLRTFSRSDVSSLTALLGDGNDVLIVSASLPALVDGGAGDDILNGGRGDNILRGGSGNDLLFGGAGNDVLLGGDGSDLLNGGSGRNILIGGNGEDVLIAGSGEEILIGGRTTFDDDDAALRSVMAEWTSSRSRANRIANLTGVGTGPRLNGNLFLLSGVTVLDDGDRDLVFGDRDDDWLFSL
jgi:PKD repeat protein